LRKIAAALAELGYVNERGAVFSPSSIKSMLAPRRAARHRPDPVDS
jgi:hypothetical protein